MGIKSGGLAATKTERIQAILNSLKTERGECSLEHLRDEEDEEVKRILRSYKGVGAKTISCVLMFCLKRRDFPVDTHVWKIAINLGWVPKGSSRDQTYDHLNLKVPDDIKYALHILLVKHGKVYRNEVRVLRACMREQDVALSPSIKMKTEAELKAEVQVEMNSEAKAETMATGKAKARMSGPCIKKARVKAEVVDRAEEYCHLHLSVDGCNKLSH